MEERTLAAAALSAVILVAIAVILVSVPHYGSGTSAQVTTTAAQQNTNQSSILFSATQYWQYAYLVSAPTLNSSAQAAISGFRIANRSVGNGAYNLTFVSLSGSMPNESFTLKNGDRLYYIEGSFSDDSPPSGEYSLGDDGFVTTNSAGYVIQ